MSYEILKNDPKFPGCDFVLQLGENRRNTKIRLLQLTDMQIIDSTQRRTPDRLRPDEIAAWLPENKEAMCTDQIKSLVAQTKPDLIFITGDIIYGQFDDSGRIFSWFCEFMGSLNVPWAPIFGNHDNEATIGVDWQCDMFSNAPNCMFTRGTVTGNGNYSVGIAAGDQLLRVMYMLDTHGCLREKGIYDDQLELIGVDAEKIKASQGREVPGFVAIHIPTEEFQLSAEEMGYTVHDPQKYHIGVDVEAKDGDFGFRNEKMSRFSCDSFLPVIHKAGVDGVFAGHCHNINTCVLYQGIRWVFGLKTGQYDYHIPGQLGGTLITLEDDSFEIAHVPALTALAPYPGLAPMFRNYFVSP